MGELYNPFPKLPKNIRQMGERDDFAKLYVEDYVNTYLKRMYPAGGQDLRVGLLLGNIESREGTPYIFIDGALEMEDVTASGEKVDFSDAAWKKAYRSIEETFPKRTVQGWFLCGTPGCTLSPLNYWKQHGQYFGGKNQIMYLNGGIDGEEAFYITSDDGFYHLKGYSVYYERNQMMQDYMILRKDARRVESGSPDRVIQDFRNRMEERKQEAVSRRGTVKTLGTLCSVLSVAVLAGGVVLIGNYQKMREMESILVSVLPSGVKEWNAYETLKEGKKKLLSGKEKRNRQEKEDGLIVEEISGGVYPLESETLKETVEDNSEEILKKIRKEWIAESEKQAGGENESAVSADNQDAAVMPGEFKSKKADEPNVLAEAELKENFGTSKETSEMPDLPVTNKKPGEIYIVQEGETLYGICFKIHDSLKYLDDIRALNGLTDLNHIIAGQKLILPDLSDEL